MSSSSSIVLSPPAVAAADIDRLIIALDTESGGEYRAANPLLALGVCVGTLRGGVLAKKRFSIAMKEDGTEKLDEVTVREFWSKNQHILDALKVGALPASVQVPAFLAYIDAELERTFGAAAVDKAVLVSDNIAADFPRIDYAIAVHAPTRPQLHVSVRQARRDVRDPNQRLGLLGSTLKQRSRQASERLAAHTHLPEDDAEQTFWWYVIMRALEHRTQAVNVNAAIELTMLLAMAESAPTVDAAKKSLLAQLAGTLPDHVVAP